MNPLKDYDDEFSYPLHTVGTASPTGENPEDEVIRKLHEVIKEVTGKEVPKKVKPRMGFIP